MTLNYLSRYSLRASRLSEGFTLSDYVPIGKDLSLVSCVLYFLFLMELKDLTFHMKASPSELAVIQMALKEFIPEDSTMHSDYHWHAKQLLESNSKLFDLAWKHWFDAP